MSLRRVFAFGLLARRLLRAFEDRNRLVAEQNRLLARLADHFSPEPPAVDRATVTTDTGISHLDATELAAALEFVARQRAATGHEPTDDEILTYLADEKTVDLQQRLLTREQEIERLTASRQDRTGRYAE